MCDAANIREHNDYAGQAALHGHKVKTKSYDSLQINDKISEASVDYDDMRDNSLNILAELRNG